MAENQHRKNYAKNYISLPHAEGQIPQLIHSLLSTLRGAGNHAALDPRNLFRVRKCLRDVEQYLQPVHRHSQPDRPQWTDPDHPAGRHPYRWSGSQHERARDDLSGWHLRTTDFHKRRDALSVLGHDQGQLQRRRAEHVCPLQIFGCDERAATDYGLQHYNDPADIKLYLLELPWFMHLCVVNQHRHLALSDAVGNHQEL